MAPELRGEVDRSRWSSEDTWQAIRRARGEASRPYDRMFGMFTNRSPNWGKELDAGHDAPMRGHVDPGRSSGCRGGLRAAMENGRADGPVHVRGPRARDAGGAGGDWVLWDAREVGVPVTELKAKRLMQKLYSLTSWRWSWMSLWQGLRATTTSPVMEMMRER